ncbi:fatty acid desaturase [Oscillatoria sp. FACHB-1407]|uniref:acyl-CoA desaturase n=1 Tax=Oscillatoria sp. FACHB-1407 TaxID=2692847 RepID=UPI00168777D3|nr:fatty acid desaturase [Oscillatoria sp. FACHB-1407]MBD2465263.1 fatty acid desaturase [Oscillatoria sp. FACHB-1407]
MTSNVIGTVHKSSQSLVLNWTSVTFFAAVHVLALSSPYFFSWSALGTAIFLHWLFGSIGICLGYHRLLTHRSFHVPKGLEYAIALIGALALQGGPIFWVAGHRRHHTYTEDVDKDPYSAKRGFWWSHMGWLLYKRPEFFEYESNRKFAPDLAKSAFYRWLDRYYLLLQIPLGVGLYLLGGWSFVVYGLFLRAVLLWHSTWLINSASHITGYRSHDSDDNSRNLWWAAILTYGEGWHNNHHAYPNVAKAGWKWWEMDMTWWVIVSLRQMGLARRIVLPPTT